MKKEFSKKLRRQIAYSHELLNRSNSLLSELADTVKRSRDLLEESYRIIAKVKVRSLFKDDPER